MQIDYELKNSIRRPEKYSVYTSSRYIRAVKCHFSFPVANILLINLLIASFNTIYNRVSAVSQQIFNFQRFGIVMEYEEKPILPVPFIIVSHAHLAGKHFYRKIKVCNQLQPFTGLQWWSVT